MRKNFVSYGDSEVILSEIKAKYLSKGEVPYTASKVETGYIEDTFSANGSGSANITFSSPMPDTDYLVVTDCDRVGVEIGIINKTVNGFTLVVSNNNVSELLIRVDYTAFELFELTTIAEIESDISTRLKIVFDVADIESPAENQTVLYMGETTTAEPIYKQGGIYEYDGTVWQLKSADNITLDDALNTTSNNAVKNSVIATEVNKRLVVTDIMPTASADLLGQTRLYIGSTTTDYQEGGIYKCESDGQTPPTYSWNIKNKADIDLSLYKKIFTGTQATWNTLTDAQKKEYDIANITDDTEDSVVDEVADGDMRAVTSNAVYDYEKTTWNGKQDTIILGDLTLPSASFNDMDSVATEIWNYVKNQNKTGLVNFYVIIENKWCNFNGRVTSSNVVGTIETLFSSNNNIWSIFCNDAGPSTSKLSTSTDLNYTTNSSNISVSDNTFTNLLEFTAPSPGKYLLLGSCTWGENSVGRRELYFASTATSDNRDRYNSVKQNGVAGTGTTMQVLTMITFTSSGQKFYLNAYQNSGSTLSAYSAIRYIRLSD